LPIAAAANIAAPFFTSRLPQPQQRLPYAASRHDYADAAAARGRLMPPAITIAAFFHTARLPDALLMPPCRCCQRATISLSFAAIRARYAVF